ncbi:MAG: hypothetical protein KDA22_06705 [Phycisphaerales bacterium]|nr:hypothetical protein [Phycisphaerales bacterium]
MSKSPFLSLAGVGMITLATVTWCGHSAFAGGCDTSCPVGGILENDFCDSDPDPNGGCNENPVAYQDIGNLSAGDISVCGQVGRYPDAAGSANLDWFRFSLDSAAFVNISINMTGPGGVVPPDLAVFLIEGDDCVTQVTQYSAIITSCPFVVDSQTLGFALPPGNHVFILGNAAATSVTLCADVNYTATLHAVPGVYPECGDPLSGSCDTAHLGGGCDNFTCCENVCAFNPDCCLTEWDDFCVELAFDPSFGCGLFLYSCTEGLPGAPVNDCATAPTPVEIDTPIAVTNVNATTDGPPNGCSYGADVWFQLQLDGEGEVTITMEEDTTFDSTIAIYGLGDSPDFDPDLLPGLLIGCVDANGPGLEAAVLVGATPGYYLIQIGGFITGTPDTGTGTMDISFERVIYNTGTTNTVTFNGANTNLGWSSGCISAASPQRWAAQPFTVEAPDEPGTSAWQVYAIHAYGFVPAAPTVTEDLCWIIFNRNGTVAPADGDQVASGCVTLPTPTDYPGGPTGEDYRIDVDVTLQPGDYYLSVYGSNSLGDCATSPSNWAWFTNAPDGIPFFDNSNNPYMYRSATFPSPGFVLYQTAAVEPGTNGDPNHLYCSGFRIKGDAVASKGCPSCPDFDNSGTVDGADLGLLLGAWGPAVPGECYDIDMSGTVDGADLGLLLGAWGPCL